MSQPIQIQLSQPEIADFCHRWQIAEFYLFGSVLRPDFRVDSDVDVMVNFQPDAPWGLLEFVRMKRELETLFGRSVDLVTKKSIEQSHNWLRRQEILENARVVYVAG
ncbi:nucleotidyltransferase family protein [[Phormidium] sp. ETS-05]|uniref:nucleotidyltransferase family protein n=1 Tax=[Phormidium] sp. ETS-05 TaxID=222819 RepID=UPI0018EF2834|nr:nucleotidyltransferase family protein [[Phormidium] sp. ETS-05]